MTENQSKDMFYNALFFVVICGMVVFNNQLSFQRGVHQGTIKTLDTIQKIVDKQIASDDAVITKVGFIGEGVKKDTLVYYLSTKKILDEN